MSPAAPVRRRPLLRLTRRLAIVAAVLLATAIVGAGYLIEPNHPRASGANREPPQPVGPPPPAGPFEPTTPHPTSPETPPAVPVVPAVAPVVPAAAFPPATHGNPAPDRTPTPTLPTTTLPPPPPVQQPDPGRMVLQRQGGTTVSCPMPYLSTAYAALAQCTELSGDRARIGWYSPFTDEFGPNSDWLKIVDTKWYDAPTLANDGVSGHARGFATIETVYGPAVWVTQYREGKGRWGMVNLITGKFYESQGWQPTG